MVSTASGACHDGGDAVGLNSCLYRVKIMHERRAPKHYRFEHDVFMFYLDLDEVNELPKRSWLFGCEQARIYNYSLRDHINKLDEFLSQHGVKDLVKKKRLLTNVRTFGYIFNPVSFYFCFDEKDSPVCVVAEIGNTFGELKYFFLGKDTMRTSVFHDQQTKHYYISPFTNLDDVMVFDISIPTSSLMIGIDVQRGGKRYFYSTMRGARIDFDTQQLFMHTLFFPFVTLKVIFLIHWHAFMLSVVKRIKHHNKEEQIELQKDVQHPARTNN